MRSVFGRVWWCDGQALNKDPSDVLCISVKLVHDVGSQWIVGGCWRLAAIVCALLAFFVDIHVAREAQQPYL